MATRIFIGAPCPPEWIPYITTLQQQIGEAEGIHHITPDNLHMTIIPPWSEEEWRIPGVISDLKAITVPPCTVALEAIEYGPDPEQPRLVWARIQPTPALEKVWLQTWRAIRMHDHPRTPLPHITITTFDPQGALPPLPIATNLPPATIDRIAVYESQGDRKYTIRGEYQLAKMN